MYTTFKDLVRILIFSQVFQFAVCIFQVFWVPPPYICFYIIIIIFIIRRRCIGIFTFVTATGKICIWNIAFFVSALAFAAVTVTVSRHQLDKSVRAILSLVRFVIKIRFSFTSQHLRWWALIVTDKLAEYHITNKQFALCKCWRNAPGDGRNLFSFSAETFIWKVLCLNQDARDSLWCSLRAIKSANKFWNFRYHLFKST